MCRVPGSVLEAGETAMNKTKIPVHLELTFFFFFFGRACGIRKFLSQGSNLQHSSDLSHSRNNARSLTAEPPGNSRAYIFVELIQP